MRTTHITAKLTTTDAKAKDRRYRNILANSGEIMESGEIRDIKNLYVMGYDGELYRIADLNTDPEKQTERYSVKAQADHGKIEGEYLVPSIEKQFGSCKVWLEKDGLHARMYFADGAVTTAKLAPDATGMVYLGATVLTATADSITFTAPTTYDNYKILAGAVMETGSSTWLDVRMLNGSSRISNTHQVQRVDGTTWGSAINSAVIYLINSLGINQYDGIDAEVDIYGGGSFWKKFHAYLGKAQGSSIITNISNGRNDSATAPNTFMLITGGTFSVGSWIKVWGWNNS